MSLASEETVGYILLVLPDGAKLLLEGDGVLELPHLLELVFANDQSDVLFPRYPLRQMKISVSESSLPGYSKESEYSWMESGLRTLLFVFIVVSLSFAEEWDLITVLVFGVIPAIPIAEWFISIFKDFSVDKEHLESLVVFQLSAYQRTNFALFGPLRGALGCLMIILADLLKEQTLCLISLRTAA